MLPKEIHEKTILFSALNWGYGHVMRSIILLKQLLEQNNELFIACNEEQEVLFKSELLNVQYLRISGYPFSFSVNGNFNQDLFRSFKRLNTYMKQEHQQVNLWCKTFHIDLVIADQSMGFYSRSKPSILITHQLNLPLKWWEKPAQTIYNKWINRFDYIWIPDTNQPFNLSGNLSKTARLNAHFIGSLSRFKDPCNCIKTYEIGALITGPEPQARAFFESCKKRFLTIDARCFIIYNRAEPENINNLTIIKHQKTNEMRHYLCSTKKLVTRCGYSTLMDLEALKIKNVEFHATPGQREQEYLFSRVTSVF